MTWKSRKSSRTSLEAEDRKSSRIVRRAILEAVENQLAMDDPPETKQTLDRLMAAGYSRQEAVKMIGGALTEEMWEMLHEQKEHDPKRYKARLDKLS